MSAAPPPPPEPPDPEQAREAAPAAPPAERYPFWTALDVLVMGVLALASLIVAGMVGLVVAQVLPHSGPSKAIQAVGGQFLFWGLWLFILAQWLHARYGRPFWRSLAWIVPSPDALKRSAAYGLLTALVVILLGALLRPPAEETPLMELLRDPISIALVGFFAVTLGPLCEELAFRGFLLPWLARWLGDALAVIGTAVLFAGLHGPVYDWSWKHLALVGLAGTAFGWMRVRSGSTATAAVMHATYNFVFFCVLVAVKSVPSLERWLI